MNNQKAIDRDEQKREMKPAESHEGAGHGDSCRCKETSKMTPRELLKLMMRDLAFWKKAKDEDDKAGPAQQPSKRAALSRQARKGSN